MKRILFLLTVLALTFSYCNFKRVDSSQFGIKYNPVRQKFGAPLIKPSMIAHNCCGAGTVYRIDKEPGDQAAYHFSKTIRTISNDKPTEEKDIYRKKLNDTTILQLNVLTWFNWAKDSAELHGSVGKIDRRTVNLKTKDFFTENSKYPSYEHMKCTQQQIDSALTAWGLSRFNKE